MEQAKEYVASIGNSTDKKVSASASYYLKAMERVMEKGEAWVTKEQARQVSSLIRTNIADNQDRWPTSFPLACSYQA